MWHLVATRLTARILVAVPLWLSGSVAFAADAELKPILAQGSVIVPDSSRPEGLGIAGAVAEAASALTAIVGVELVAPQEIRNANTNISIFVPAIPLEPASPGVATNPNYFIETPASIACIYGLVPRTYGCNPNSVATNATGGSNVIVIVDAFDDPNVKADLDVFSKRFNLPPVDFDVTYASGKKPPANQDWELEIALDVEWAHAIAPGAKIRLVEAASAGVDDLITAIDVANTIVTQFHGGEISMSWDGAEYSGEVAENAQHFSTPGAVYFAASGDSPGVYHPAALARVVGVGGTTIVRDASGSFLGEIPWDQEGAGVSAYEDRPDYQSSIALVGASRGNVDLSAVANPDVGGVWVYDSGNRNVATNHGWTSLGGTSVATPIVAAIANSSGRFLPATSDELHLLYGEIGSQTFNHIGSGHCGPNGRYQSGGQGWTFCSGVGSPSGKTGL